MKNNHPGILLLRKNNRRKAIYRNFRLALLSCCLSLTVGCADALLPEGRSVDIPPPVSPPERKEAINETVDSITYVALGQDVLVPKAQGVEPLPKDRVGPYELRGETVAGALQLILAPYDMPLAFETEEGLERRVTVSNLKGTLETVISRVCGLGDLYCSYEDGVLVVKETETFAVSLPPLDNDDFSFDDIAVGLEAVTGVQPTVDEATNTIVYTATHRNAKKAEHYFKRLRASTALVVYETYIWEVQLNAINSAGINWDKIIEVGNYTTPISLAGTLSNQVGTPISIGLPTKGAVNLGTEDVFRFISEQGAVKTISQPQLTVLSGSSATLRVAETRNYVESLSRTIDDNTNNETVSTTTGTVDTGFTLTIGSSWDNATVYGNVNIELQEFLGFETFDAGSDDTLQLPRTSERSLETQVRVRPGDSVLIAGLVRERDEGDVAGPGFMTPLLPTGRTVSTENTELVFLLRPRVIVYDSPDDVAERHERQRSMAQKMAHKKVEDNFQISELYALFDGMLEPWEEEEEEAREKPSKKVKSMPVIEKASITKEALNPQEIEPSSGQAAEEIEEKIIASQRKESDKESKKLSLFDRIIKGSEDVFETADLSDEQQTNKMNIIWSDASASMIPIKTVKAPQQGNATNILQMLEGQEKENLLSDLKEPGKQLRSKPIIETSQ